MSLAHQRGKEHSNQLPVDLRALIKSTTQAADATGRCNDGSYTSSATKQGACSGHDGVRDWYAARVWVNKETKLYHCPTDQWYGKTKDGAYMSEADAKAHGYHADHGKACQ